jgi:uncharacterized Zn-binding protein involved in type VI secretion
MPQAARIFDLTGHGVPASPGLGSAKVKIGTLPAWRAMVDTHVCPIPIAPPAPAMHGPEKCYLGSTTVLINNKMACRQGDTLQGGGPPNSFAMGCPNVLIGDVGYGMADEARRAAYAAAMAQLYRDWDSLTPEQRRQRMADALALATPPGMPRLEIRSENLDPNTYGALDFRHWNIGINQSLLEGDMTPERFQELSDTVYHEGRHGEQWYNAAQYRASQDESATDIATNTRLPQHVAEAAHDHPAGPGTSEGAMGEAVNTSVYGDRGAYRGQTYRDMDNDVPGAFDRYQALPEEEDARRQGNEAGSEVGNQLGGP